MIIKIKTIIIIFITIILSGCSYFIIDNRVSEKYNSYPNISDSFNSIFINNPKTNSGYNLKGSLYQSIKSDRTFRIITKINRVRKTTAIIVPELISARYWEIDLNEYLKGEPDLVEEVNKRKVDYPTIINNPVIANVKVTVGISIYNSEYQFIYSNQEDVTFQQIYFNPNEIMNRPDGELEIDRLIKLGFDRLVYNINDKRKVHTYFEQGKSSNSFRSLVPFLSGNSTMLKGIRFAQGEKLYYAITAWLKVAYEPEGIEDIFFITNRASAYYNIAQLYAHNSMWKEAEIYYSYANLTNSKLHYAQGWADSISNQLKFKENNIDLNIELIESSKKIELPKKITGYIEPDINLLLKEEVLYPKIFQKE